MLDEKCSSVLLESGVLSFRTSASESDTDLGEEEDGHHEEKHQDVDGRGVSWVPLVHGDGHQTPHHSRVGREGVTDIFPPQRQLQEEVDGDDHGQEGQGQARGHGHGDANGVDRKGVEDQHVGHGQPRQVHGESVLDQDNQTSHVLPESDEKKKQKNIEQERVYRAEREHDMWQHFSFCFSDTEISRHTEHLAV